VYDLWVQADIVKTRNAGCLDGQAMAVNNWYFAYFENMCHPNLRDFCGYAQPVE